MIFGNKEDLEVIKLLSIGKFLENLEILLENQRENVLTAFLIY